MQTPPLHRPFVAAPHSGWGPLEGLRRRAFRGPPQLYQRPTAPNGIIQTEKSGSMKREEVRHMNVEKESQMAQTK